MNQIERLSYAIRHFHLARAALALRALGVSGRFATDQLQRLQAALTPSAPVKRSARAERRKRRG